MKALFYSEAYGSVLGRRPLTQRPFQFLLLGVAERALAIAIATLDPFPHFKLFLFILFR